MGFVSRSISLVGELRKGWLLVVSYLHLSLGQAFVVFSVLKPYLRREQPLGVGALTVEHQHGFVLVLAQRVA
jgi:hypothetical protein